MARKRGLWPPPVYECQLADGTATRLSFWSPDGKPVDFASGRRAAEELLLTDWQAAVTWERSRGYWRAQRARRDTVAEDVPTLTGFAAWDYRVTLGRVAVYRGEPEFFMGPWPPWRRVDHGAIVRRFVEHDTIPGGRVEDAGEPAAMPERAARKRAARDPERAAPDPIAIDPNVDLITALANIAARGAQGDDGKALAKLARAALVKARVIKTEGGANANAAQQGMAA